MCEEEEEEVEEEGRGVTSLCYRAPLVVFHSALVLLDAYSNTTLLCVPV